MSEDLRERIADAIAGAAEKPGADYAAMAAAVLKLFDHVREEWGVRYMSQWRDSMVGTRHVAERIAQRHGDDAVVIRWCRILTKREEVER